MSTSDNTTHICLLALPENEAALLTRVIRFAQNQGKTYQLQANPALANIIIVSGQYDTTQWQAQHYIIRIAAQTTHPDEHLLPPPLFITRVMRTLDDAIQHLQQRTVPIVTSEANLTTTITNTPKETTPIPSINTDENSIENPTNEPSAPNYLALVIDDSFAIRKQLEIELQTLGIQTHMAEDGEMALKMSKEQHYDLIFLDIIMPNIDGYEVCKTMRQREKTRKIPIIMLSGKDSPLDEVKGVLAGATTYLTKPVKQERLAQTVKRVLNWLSEYATKR